eukprot:10772089-Prorocentrum_lima.AAC.1
MMQSVRGLHRPLGPCYGADTDGLNGVASVMPYRYCSHNFGVGPLLSTQKGGAVADSPVMIGPDYRIVRYRPRVDFAGSDVF